MQIPWSRLRNQRKSWYILIKCSIGRGVKIPFSDLTMVLGKAFKMKKSGV